jgi:hypothetical protein
LPISVHRVQPSTAGASTSTMRWISGSEHASSQKPAPSRITSTGSASLAAAIDSPMRVATSPSTRSNTAANSSVLSAKW